MNKKKFAIAGLSGMLLIAVLSCLLIWHQGKRRSEALESELAELRALEKRSAVVKGVSRRMEEIAFQQKLVSDDRREKAIEQAHIAQEMTRISEIERQKALEAQKAATASEQSAREAYRHAEREREVAEHQRTEAEYAKRVADTLSYISLGQSLGLRAQSLFQTGKTELAGMVAYLAYIYAKEYGKEELYKSSLYEALKLTSHSSTTKALKNGAIAGLAHIPRTRYLLVTANILGEIYLHEGGGSTIRSSKLLLRDSKYKFKDVYTGTNGGVYAISRTGHLVILNDNQTVVVPVNQMTSPAHIVNIGDDSQLLIIGKDGMAVYDTKKKSLSATKKLDYEVTCVASREGKPLLFDNQGRMHLVHSLQQITTSKVPVKGTITAYAYSGAQGYAAYGTVDGTIHCVTDDGQTTQFLGHRSRITKLCFGLEDLYSSSLDGSVVMWFGSTQRLKSKSNQEPLLLISSKQWIDNFVLGPGCHFLWATTENGSLLQNTILAEEMAEMVRKSLKRNFTQEEWNYYIGSNVPYRKLI